MKWKRAEILRWFVIVLMASLLGYIATITAGVTYRQVKSVAGIRKRETQLYALRGTIYDQNENALTNAEDCYYLLVDPRGFDPANLDALCRYTETYGDTITNALQKEELFVLKSKLRPARMAGVYSFAGVRRYDTRQTAVHLLGYVNGDHHGVSGLEKAFESVLLDAGGKKKAVYTVDAAAGAMMGLGVTLVGENGNYKDGVITTLDKDLQIALEEAMKGHIAMGAAVILDAESGAIRAMASVPTFDAERVADYLQGQKGELVNRAITNQTVGSVFKTVVAAAALEKDLGNFTYQCTGAITVGGRELSCHNRDGHGEMTLDEAFSASCNPYFIALGQLLGSEVILHTAQRFGFADPLEIAEGLVSPAGNLPQGTLTTQEIANLSIGQGVLLATPLQIARLTAVAANGGYLVQPYLRQGEVVNGVRKERTEGEPREQIIETDIATRLWEMYVGAVESGTGAAAKPQSGGAGGKTSSAQTGRFVGTREILNTYFAGFYPAETPKYVIAVFAQDGVSGSKTCAPVFKAVCDFIAQNGD